MEIGQLKIPAESMPAPLFSRIANNVSFNIAVGKFNPGDLLPSIHGLAASLEVNFNTIMKAYAALVRDDLLTARTGVGHFVASNEEVRQLQARGLAMVAYIESLGLHLAALNLRSININAWINEVIPEASFRYTQRYRETYE